MLPILSLALQFTDEELRAPQTKRDMEMEVQHHETTAIQGSSCLAQSPDGIAIEKLLLHNLKRLRELFIVLLEECEPEALYF